MIVVCKVCLFTFFSLHVGAEKFLMCIYFIFTFGKQFFSCKLLNKRNRYGVNLLFCDQFLINREISYEFSLMG